MYNHKPNISQCNHQTLTPCRMLLYMVRVTETTITGKMTKIRGKTCPTCRILLCIVRVAKLLCIVRVTETIIVGSMTKIGCETFPISNMFLLMIWVTETINAGSITKIGCETCPTFLTPYQQEDAHELDIDLDNKNTGSKTEHIWLPCVLDHYSTYTIIASL